VKEPYAGATGYFVATFKTFVNCSYLVPRLREKKKDLPEPVIRSPADLQSSGSNVEERISGPGARFFFSPMRSERRIIRTEPELAFALLELKRTELRTNTPSTRAQRQGCIPFFEIGFSLEKHIGNREFFEIELELIQTQMAQKPMLRAEVYARALRASLLTCN
jgi:hypothetical protein